MLPPASLVLGLCPTSPLPGCLPLQIFIIVYGQMQSWTPQQVLQPLRQSPPTRLVATGWAAVLAVPTAVLGEWPQG